MVTCGCGADVFYKKHGQCKRCYHRDYNAEYHRARYVPKAREPKPLTVGECSYNGAHTRLLDRRGSASAHTCECGNQAEQWALNEERSTTLQRGERTVYGSNGKRVRAAHVATAVWSGNPDDYDALCIYCHIERDRGERMSPLERRQKQKVHTANWWAKKTEDERAAYKQRRAEAERQRLESMPKTCKCGRQSKYVRTGECATCYARRRYLAQKAGTWTGVGSRMPGW